MKKRLVIFISLLSAGITQAQNMGVGASSPAAKLDIRGTAASPSIPGSSSTGILRIGVASNEGVDIGKMGEFPYAGWVQSGFNDDLTHPLSLQPLGGNVGIGTTTPYSTLDVTGNSNTTGNFLNISNGINSTAVTGRCENIPAYGYGVQGYGGSCGVQGTASLTGAGIRAGLSGYGASGEDENYGVIAAGVGGTNAYGVSGTAAGGTNAYAIFGTAYGATNNWAGYFESGDVHIQNKLGIGTTTPYSTLDVTGYLNTTGNFLNISNGINSTAVTGRCENIPAYGYGVQGYGGSVGVLGMASLTGAGIRVGLYGYGGSGENENYGVNAVGVGGTNAYGVSGTAAGGTNAYAIFGTAYGATNNWAGYFENGNVGIENNLSIGTTMSAAKLHIDHYSTQSNPQLLLYESASNNYSRLNFQNASGSSYWAIAGYNDTTNANERLNFYNSTSGDLMSIAGNGFVGIGTSSPTSKLQVVGLPVYADNGAALGGGLTVGAFYRTATGVVMVVF